MLEALSSFGRSWVWRSVSSEGQAGPSLSVPRLEAGSHGYGHITGRDLNPLPQTLPLPNFALSTSSHTSAVAVVIFVPPEAPTTILIFFVLSNKMEGHMEDTGCLPVGDTDATEVQFPACNLQTASSCCTSKPKVSISTFLTHLMFCSSRVSHCLLYTSPPCSHNTKLSPGLMCRGAEGSFIYGAVSVGVVYHTAASPTPQDFPFCPFSSLSPSKA